MSRLATRSRRSRFVILRTAGSPPVALHPASLRRSYLRFLGCDQPRHGLAPCRQSVLADALVAGRVPGIRCGTDEGGDGRATPHAHQDKGRAGEKSPLPLWGWGGGGSAPK